MSLWRQLSHGVRALLGGRAIDHEVDEELASFLDESAAELERDGVAPEEARRMARLRAGNPLAMREEVRASGWEHAVEVFLADVRYGLRRLRRESTFTAVTIATLALGIGSAVAIVSVATPIFLQALPLPGADRVHVIWDRAQDGSRVEMAFGSVAEIEERSRSIAAASASRVWQPTLSGSFTPERLDGFGVNANYFRVLGVSPVLGRAFDAADDRPGGTPVVLLSDRLWRRRFGADPSVVGSQVALDGYGYEVIGVMPAALEHRLLPSADVWRALQYDRALPPQGREWGHHLRMMVRLRDGVSLAAADAELNQIARDPIGRFARPPWANLRQGVIVDPLLYAQTRDTRPAMLAVLAAATLLLLIACVNVINLLLARNAQRRAEFAMRTALGAGRGRLVRQLLTETLVLVSAGGLAGLLVAQAILRAFVSLGTDELPRVAGLGIDAPLFSIAFAVTMAVGVVVALFPALSNPDLKAAIPHGARQASSHHVMRRSLVVAEVAFALVLLAGASLLFRSLQHLFAVTTGFDDRNVLTLQVQVAGPRYRDAATVHRFFAAALDAVKRVPGVANAALTTQLPLSGDSDIYGVKFETTSTDPGVQDGGAFRYAVSPEYFDAMRIPLGRGRLLSAQDRDGTTPVVLINESLARRRFRNADPIGQRLHVGPTDRPWYTVVGVVGDVRQISLEDDGFDAVYMTAEQWSFPDLARWFVIRAHGDAAALAPEIQRAIWSLDKDQPIVRVALLSRWVAATAATRRFALILFQAFGLAALLLTAIGIYGVVSGGVTERVREIGVRTALGASRRSILAMVMGQGLWLSVAGVAIGAIAAALASRGLTTMLFGISPLDPASYAAVAILLIGVAMAASWMPAWRASRVDPAVTLRSE